jgi:hypothetical protein
MSEADIDKLMLMSGGKGDVKKAKRALPEALKIRQDFAKIIVKDTNFTGMQIPVQKTISWIAEKSKSTDSIQKIKEAMEYYKTHKDECHKKLAELKKDYEATKKSSKKASRTKATATKKTSKKASRTKATATKKSSKKASRTKATATKKSSKKASKTKTVKKSSKKTTTKRKC